MKKRVYGRITILIIFSLLTGIFPIFAQINNDEVSVYSKYYPEIGDIIAGGYHSIALDRRGDIFVFGSNRYGEVGLGYTSEEGIIYDTSIDDSGFAENVSSRGDHILALKEGKVYSWGLNNHGQLGNGNRVNLSFMEPVIGLDDVEVVSIAAGHQFSLALTSEGDVYAWGHNGYGQVGIGIISEEQLIPVKVNISDVKQISAGHYHALVQKNDGSIWGWGRNLNGALGDTGSEYNPNPVQIDVGHVKTVVAGTNNSFFITNNNSVYACGNNEKSQFGDGTRNNRLFPSPIEGIADVVKISSNSCTVFLKANGEAYGAGMNNYGQLGMGEGVNRVETLTKIPGEGYTNVSVGGAHTLLYWGTPYNGGMYGGKVYAMGRNQYYQCGQGSPENIYYPTEISNIQEIDDRESYIPLEDIPSCADRQLLLPTEDTYINQHESTQNFSEDKVCGINYTQKENAGSGWGQYAYLKFDITGIPKEKVYSAKLWVYVSEDSDARKSTRMIGIYDTQTDDWNAGTMTWSNGKVNENELLGSFEVTGNGSIITDAGWKSIDLTNYIRRGDKDTISLMAKMLTDTAHPVNICSSENDSKIAPRLVIESINDRTVFNVDEIITDIMVDTDVVGSEEAPKTYLFKAPENGAYSIHGLRDLSYFSYPIQLELYNMKGDILYSSRYYHEKEGGFPPNDYAFGHFINLEKDTLYYICVYDSLCLNITPHNKNHCFDDAVSLPIEAEVIGNITSPNDFLVYKFVAEQDGIYRIHTTGDVNTKGYLYDFEKNIFAWNQYTSKLNLFEGWQGFCMVDTNFGITTYLEAGKIYYLGIESGQKTFNESETGNFALIVELYNVSSPPTSGYEKVYEPQKWNTENIQGRTQCYAYALNLQNQGWINPGSLWEKYASGGEKVDYDQFYVDNDGFFELRPKEEIGQIIVDYAIKDAEAMGGTFVPIGENEVCPQGTYKVSLVLSLIYDDTNGGSFIDYHWYRQNPNGTWSHKPGGATVRDWDNSGLTIYYPTPDMANTWDYNCFVGYFAVKDCEPLLRTNILSDEIQTNQIIEDTILRNSGEILSLQDFDFIYSGMTKEEIINTLGYPHKRGGRGILREIYYINNEEKIMLCYYGDNTLFSVLMEDHEGKVFRIK